MSLDPGAPFVVPYHPARSFFLRRGLYALLAFDAWLVMLEHGGRYGAGDFNVAHFAWIDRILRVPTPALYIGILISTGVLALTMTFVRATTGQRLLLAGLYTSSWMISLHDSYQHHYLLSWLLAWSAFTPERSAAEALATTDVTATPAVGVTLTAFTCSIVYLFTGISKTSPEWRSGAVLGRLTRASSARSTLEPLLNDLSQALDASPLRVLSLLSLGLVALQWLVAIAYALVPGCDGARVSVVRRTLLSLGLGAALAFHLGAELSGIFEIGWFSYYMLWIAGVLLTPATWVVRLAAALSRLAQLLVRWGHGLRSKPAYVLAGVAIGFVVTCGALLDVPGGLAACAVTAAILAGMFWRASSQGAPVLAGWALSAMFASLCLWGAVTQTSVRFDLYRRWAGELSRMGEAEQALILYRKAERYAPSGTSRAKQIETLERQLAK